ncbi:MAG: 2,3-bisphosphoglycerate-independent phosphoglycerate mutase [Balneolaceae bacterium]
MKPAQERKALLIIIDGFGISANPAVSAVHKARKPFYDSLLNSYPNAQLEASGEAVGLPAGQFGNSEVGHLNIGAGRIVWQELSRVNKSIRDSSFFENSVLKEAFQKASVKGRIHFMGLFSDGGVHSTNDHLYALLDFAKRTGIDNTYVHAFTDGRDTSPTGGLDYYREFAAKADEIGTGTLASVIGRYYAMDRDNRWERIQKAYDLLVRGKGETADSAEDIFTNSYNSGVTDEFLLPHLADTSPNSRIQPGDVVVFFNIRGDRARQITKALHRFDEVPFDTQELDLHYVTFTAYEDTFNRFAHVAFPPVRLKNTLGETVSRHGLSQLRIAETEKYPHVTYFFNGGEETPYEGEERIMVPSPKVATYDLQPEMSAEKVTDRLCEELHKGTHSFVALNFANPDMVGHTGVMDAAVQAIEFIDTQLKRVVSAAQENGYSIVIISDHGNSDTMVQDDGSPHTAHTTAQVPVIVLSQQAVDAVKNGNLADVAPTILTLMGLPIPKEMTGQPLI